MSEHTQLSRADDESTEASEQPSRTEYVERSDVGVSLTVKLTRGTGTRDQDKITGKIKAKRSKTPARTWKSSGDTSTISLKTPVGSSQQPHTKHNSFVCCTNLCNHRMYEVCGEKEFKVLLALNSGDSISGVARKIDENRETIRRVVSRLEEAGYVAYDDGLQLLDQTIRDIGLEFLAAAAGTSPPSIPEAYVLPQFAGLNYAFTAIDAVYVWTRERPDSHRESRHRLHR